MSSGPGGALALPALSIRLSTSYLPYASSKIFIIVVRVSNQVALGIT
ncbi:MAG: hypothetical protein PWP65_29 [Clostridia bacterium]|nr:hypothetical protein [Clostridia bacterium]